MDRVSTSQSELLADAISVVFQGLTAVEDVSLSVRPGEILGLIGPNGAGKTTLVNVLTGFQPPTKGEVALDGQPLNAWPPELRARRGLARTFQNVLLFKGLTVFENVEAGAIAAGADRLEAARRTWEILDWLDLADRAKVRAGTLPFGDERRIGIGRAIAMGPRYVLMDEPAAGLNDAECLGLEQIVRRIRDDLRCGILLIEHRMSLVFALCDRIHVLDHGRTLAEGSAEAIRADKEVRRAYLGDGLH